MPSKERNFKIETSLLKEINSFFYLNKDPTGSKEKLKNLIENFDSKNFLIAGSWGIELTSGKPLKHDDIDLIILQNPSYYIDDAIEIEESCFDIIPLDLDYFEKNFLERKFEEKKIYAPSYNLQICLKLIGQLQEKFPERAIEQLKILLESYPNFEKEKSQKEILYIIEKLAPEELNHKVISNHVVNAIELYLTGEKEKSIEEFIRLHSLINKTLRYQFEKRGLTKKIKISEK